VVCVPKATARQDPTMMRKVPNRIRWVRRSFRNMRELLYVCVCVCVCVCICMCVCGEGYAFEKHSGEGK